MSVRDSAAIPGLIDPALVVLAIGGGLLIVAVIAAAARNYAVVDFLLWIAFPGMFVGLCMVAVAVVGWWVLVAVAVALLLFLLFRVTRRP